MTAPDLLPGGDLPADPVAALVTIDQAPDGEDVLRQAFKAPQIDGREPFVRRKVIDRAVAATDLLPPDAAIVRSFATDTASSTLARGPRGSLLIQTMPDLCIVTVGAASLELSEALMQDVLDLAPDTIEPGTVPLRTWHLGGTHVISHDRRIEAPVWAEIARNYPPAVRRRLQRLFDLDGGPDRGRLILWHGEPGTGKTTALRALLRAWEPWCAGQYIADPERLFSETVYLTQVLTNPTRDRPGPTSRRGPEADAMWRLIIAEDSDEYLRASARRDAGAGLGRLLNVTDGLLGQGFNALILLTTNEEVHRLHPALIRPGRCLARVEFAGFQPAEAREWLPDGVRPPDQETTLAELFERRGAVTRIGVEQGAERRPGVYL